MTYMLGGRQYLVSTNSSTEKGAELVCFRLPEAPAAAARPAGQPVDPC